MTRKITVELLGPVPRTDYQPVEWVVRVTVAGAQSFLVHLHCLYERHRADPRAWGTVGTRAEMNALPYYEQGNIARMSRALLAEQHRQ